MQDKTFYTQVILKKSRDELIIDFNRECKELVAQNGICKIIPVVPTVPEFDTSFDLKTCKELLQQIIELLELMEREKYSLSLVHERHSQ